MHNLGRSRGRPKRCEFTGIFLPSVEWEMAIEGQPWHELESHPGSVGTLFRHCRREDVSLGQMLKTMRCAIDELEPRTEAAGQLVQVFKAQISDLLANPDGALQQREAIHDKWKWFLSGVAPDEHFPTYFMRRYVEVESASMDAAAAFSRGKYQRAAELIAATPSLQLFWRPQDLDALALAQSVDETKHLRLRAWLELQLSIVADRAMTSAPSTQAQRLCGAWSDLLAGEVLQPGKHWLRRAKELAGAASLSDLLQQLTAAGTATASLPSEATIKRWSSGSVFPPVHHALGAFATRVAERAHVRRPSLSSEHARDALVRTYSAANRFRHVGIAAEVLGLAPQEVRQSYLVWCDRFKNQVASQREEGAA